jgi:hypothetical protein
MPFASKLFRIAAGEVPLVPVVYQDEPVKPSAVSVECESARRAQQRSFSHHFFFFEIQSSLICMAPGCEV